MSMDGKVNTGVKVNVMVTVKVNGEGCEVNGEV